MRGTTSCLVMGRGEYPGQRPGGERLPARRRRRSESAAPGGVGRPTALGTDQATRCSRTADGNGDGQADDLSERPWSGGRRDDARPSMQADMNWFAVLAHHATRTPDKAITVFEGETTTYGEMARRADRTGRRPGRTWRRSWRRRGSALVQLPRVPGDGLRRQLPRRHRHADQLAARRARGAVHPRALRSPGARLRRATRRSRRRGDEGHRSLARARVPLGGADGRMDQPRRSAGCPEQVGPCPGGGRRRPPLDVHVGHHGTAQGRHDHPRQPGVEEPRAHHRVRLHQLRSRTGLRSSVPRRRTRPHDDLADRRRRHDHHPSFVRRRPTWSTSSSDHG